MIVEPLAIFRLPKTLNVPDDTVSVPLFVNVRLQNVLSVIPTFTVPPLTVNNPVDAAFVIPVVAAPVTVVIPPDPVNVPVLVIVVVTFITPAETLTFELALFVSEVVVVRLPPPTFTVPLFVSVVVVVKAPAFTLRVPPEFTVKVLAAWPALLTVTVWPDAIVTASADVGTVPLFQVEPVAQSPEAAETNGRSALAIPT